MSIGLVGKETRLRRTEKNPELATGKSDLFAFSANRKANLKQVQARISKTGRSTARPNGDGAAA